MPHYKPTINLSKITLPSSVECNGAEVSVDCTDGDDVPVITITTSTAGFNADQLAAEEMVRAAKAPEKFREYVKDFVSDFKPGDMDNIGQRHKVYRHLFQLATSLGVAEDYEIKPTNTGYEVFFNGSTA
jgi:hypothetical protein